MRKLNNMTRAVILLAICVLSIAAISFSWLSRPLTSENTEGNYGELKLSTIKGAADSGGTGAVNAYTRMNNNAKAVTATTYQATINSETGKYEKGNKLSAKSEVNVPANDCVYMMTELVNSNSEIPTRVSLKVPTFTNIVDNVTMYSYAPYKDQAGEYIVKNIEVVSGKPVTVKWYFTNSGSDPVYLKLSTLPSVEYFK